MTIDTSKLKRYKPGYVHSNDGPGYLSMLARDDGEYVRLEDVKAITSALEQALTQQQAEVEQLRLDLGHTQSLLAMRNDEIEAMTQQRGECEVDITGAIKRLNEIARRIRNMSPNVSVEVEQLASDLSMGTTTPQPSADAVRELVAKWREDAEIADRNTEGNSYASCADELESLLSGGSNA